MSDSEKQQINLQTAFLSSSEMGALIRSIDWSQTPLGPMHTWPQSLQTAISICLHSRFPIHIWWGPELIELYNDAYRPILGSSKHPQAMGGRGREIWSEIWHIIGPMLESVYRERNATWSDDQMLPVHRNGFTEETYFTFSYSPIFDESGGVGGIFTAVTETTKRVLGERRLGTLRDLADRASEGKTAEEACQIAAHAMGLNNADVPFNLIYLLDSPGSKAMLAGYAGVEPEMTIIAPEIDLDQADQIWPLQQVMETGKPAIIEALGRYFDVPPAGPWPETPHTAVVLPMFAPASGEVTGFVIVGVSARLALDDDYLGFFNLVAAQVSTAIANGRAYEEERRRAEALAALDHAKTEFFSNISHEFRTPLTLMLNPLQEVLDGSLGELDEHQREAVEAAYRNSLRLLKLVNNLLDFSRIQTNRLHATFQPTDLSMLTADLASVFRAAVERAGLRLVVDCPPLPHLVYVDRDMWEKVVLNLLSNAFKFTFTGEISVSLRSLDHHVELTVRDTGVGIAPDELPQIFERFHRVRGVQSRTYEGSGIGLSLVQELVRYHGGQIDVSSEVGAGTTFTVSIPLGAAHLPQEQTKNELSSTALGAVPFSEEAARWLPDEELNTIRNGNALEGCVLIVDDNADMRMYLRRLIEQRYEVEIASDGESALEKIQQRKPDLVLADVMMPGMDGFELLRNLRRNVETQALPVILLSARAGEEARVEGLAAGADDYLVKPFSGRELLARVDANLKIARLYEAERAARQEAERANALKMQFLGMISHELRTPLTSIKGFASTLLAHDVHYTPEMQRDFVGVIDEEADKLTELIDQLLNLTRLQSGSMAISPQPCPLGEAFQVARVQIETLAREHKLVVNILDDLPQVMIDAQRIAQIFVNLVGNAVKFSPAQSLIEIAAVEAGDFVQVTVCDEGAGIPLEARETVFEAFQQLERKAPNGRPGAGLGLAICKGLVEAHGGRIWVDNHDGNGTHIAFTLPGVKK